MRFKEVINRIVGLTGYTIHKIAPEYMVAYKGVYNQDGLRSIHNHKFMLDPDFCKAYDRGILACNADYHWHWRVHIGLWAAFSASKLKGDFVECGVNYGFLSSAIMEYLNWDSLDKTFYLMDTFSGIDERYVSDDKHRCGILEQNKSGFYTTSFEPVKKNFSNGRM